MKVTPLDLRQAQFRSKLRGFDPDEVTPFLADAAYELEQALKEIDRLRQEAARRRSSSRSSASARTPCATRSSPRSGSPIR